MLKLKQFIYSNFEIGVYPELSKTEKKRVRLLNMICFTRYMIVLLFGVSDYFLVENYNQVVLDYAGQTVFLIFTQYLQYKRKLFSARMFFVIISLLHFLYFANFTVTGRLVELFFLFIPLFSLLFFDKKLYHYVFLVLSLLAFTIPKELFSHYDDVIFEDPTLVPMFFVSVFLLVSYFKNLNIQNEKLLEEQKNSALEANKKMELQRKELSELYGFQTHFMVNLSHEIRTPLTLIKGGASQLRSELNLNNITAINKRIDNNADKIKHLVDNIIDIAKMNTNKLELNKKCFFILPFVLKVSASFDSLFSVKGVRFNIEQPNIQERFLINGDKVYLERAISNLIMNAQKYCSKGDNVTIRIMVDSDVFRFEIEDTGCGIPSEDLEMIFKSFYRSHNSINQAGGSGIGLSFAKEVIALHGGVIKVSSQENVGSIFSIELPLLESESYEEADSLAIITPQLDKYKGNSVLLVEDNTEMQDYLINILSSFDVTIANNGKEALIHLETLKPKLIITDFMMPEMNGFEFVTEVKNKNIECPVIVLTASMDETNKLDFLRLGIDDYLTKPFLEEELLIRIGHSLSNSRSKNAFEQTVEKLEVADTFTMEVKSLVLRNIDSFVFTVSDIAEHLSITERTLNRRIKSATGLTPNGFIREIKLIEANQMLLTETDITLKEVTLRLGFKNTTHFSGLYKKRFGKKPLE